MKTKFTFYYSLLLLFLISSCTNIKKEYKDGQEAWDGVNGAKYNDIVEVWGEPLETTPYDDYVDCKWTSSQVNIQEGNTDGYITLSFEKWYTSIGTYKGTGKPRDLNCGDWQYLDGHKMKTHRVKF